MKQITWLLSAVILVTTLIIAGCSFDSSNNPTTTVATVKTSIAGQVVDESGKPMAGVEVSIGTSKATTTSYGTFMISNIDVPNNRCVIKASKSGYFTAFRAEEPRAGSVTRVILGMMSSAPQGSFSATTGKTVTLPNTSSVVFPANGYVTSNGAAYSGQVSYVVRHLDPTSSNFYDFFAGDFQGRSTDGTNANLLSYGVLRVELTGASGEKLNIAPGSKATLSVPVPAGMQSYAPNTMPLWSFDETLGMWKEESVATKTGNKYVGDVSHFSEWNFDSKGDTARLQIRVHCDNENIAGVVVRVGERKVTTDENITGIRRVQAGVPIKIKVYASDNNGLESNEIEVTLTNGEVKDVDLQLTTCPAFITGVLNNCENQPIDGTIVGEYANGSGYFYGFARNGQFKIRVRDGVAMTVKAMANDGRESDVIGVPALASSQVYSVGTLTACTGSIIESKDYDLGLNSKDGQANGVISQDGTKYYVKVDNKLKIYNTADGLLIDEFSVSNSGSGKDSITVTNQPLEVSTNGSVALVQTAYSKFETYNINTKNKLASFDAYNAHLSPDGLRVVAGNYSNKQEYLLQVFNAADGTLIRDITTVNGNTIKYVMLLSDFLNNNEFAIETETTPLTMYVIDANTGNVTRSFATSIRNIIAYSNDGTVVLATGNTEGTPGSFFSMTDGKEIATVMYSAGQREYFYNYPAAITPDNKNAALQLVSYTSSQNAPSPAIFSVGSGVLTKSLPTPATNTRFQTFSYSANGTKLAGLYADASGNYKFRIWKF